MGYDGSEASRGAVDWAVEEATDSALGLAFEAALARPVLIAHTRRLDGLTHPSR